MKPLMPKGVEHDDDHTEADIILTDEGLACRLDWDPWPCLERRLRDLRAARQAQDSEEAGT